MASGTTSPTVKDAVPILFAELGPQFTIKPTRAEPALSCGQCRAGTSRVIMVVTTNDHGRCRSGRVICANFLAPARLKPLVTDLVLYFPCRRIGSLKGEGLRKSLGAAEPITADGLTLLGSCRRGDAGGPDEGLNARGETSAKTFNHSIMLDRTESIGYAERYRVDLSADGGGA